MSGRRKKHYAKWAADEKHYAKRAADEKQYAKWAADEKNTMLNERPKKNATRRVSLSRLLYYSLNHSLLQAHAHDK